MQCIKITSLIPYRKISHKVLIPSMQHNTLGVPPYTCYIDMWRPKKVKVFSSFGHKKGIDFSHFAHIGVSRFAFLEFVFLEPKQNSG